MPNMNDNSARMDMRAMRVEPLFGEVMAIVARYIDDCENLNDVGNELFALFHKRGIHVLTDQARAELGLAPRGPEGWTAEEIKLLDARMLTILRSPVVVRPAIIPLEPAP